MEPIYIDSDGPAFIFGTHDIPTAVTVMRADVSGCCDLDMEVAVTDVDEATIVDLASTAVWLAGPDDADPADWVQVDAGTPGAVPALILERL